MIVTVDARVASSLSRGHPWVYRDAVKSTRGSPKTGDVVRVHGPGGEALGWGLFDAGSPLAVRLYGIGGASKLDERALLDAIERAAARRDGLFAPDVTTAYRLCHGEGDRVPGLVLDRYGDVVVARSDGAAMDAWLDRLAPGIARRLTERGVRSLVARIEAGPNERKTRHLAGDEAPEVLEVIEHGMAFEVDVARGQKTGAFLDQRENRRRVRALARGRGRVLNLFSYAGGFSLAAALGGAEAVTSVDAASRAHATAQRSFKLNGLSIATHAFVTADAFVYLEAAAKRRERFDLVVSDPPSFAPSERAKKKALSAYAKLHRACAALLAEGGLFCASSCSSHVSMDEFLGTLDDAALGRADLAVLETHGAPPDHPTLAAFPEGRYLKFVVMG